MAAAGASYLPGAAAAFVVPGAAAAGRSYPPGVDAAEASCLLVMAAAEASGCTFRAETRRRRRTRVGGVVPPERGRGGYLLAEALYLLGSAAAERSCLLSVAAAGRLHPPGVV